MQGTGRETVEMIYAWHELHGTEPDWETIGKGNLGFTVGLLNSLGKQAKDAVEGAAVLVHGALVKLPVELVLGIANLVKDPQGTVENTIESIVAGIQALPEYIEHAPAEVKAYLDSINSLEDLYEQGEALGKLVGDVLPTAVVTGSILDRTFQRVGGAAKGFNKVSQGGRRIGSFGKLGTVVKNPNLHISDISIHGLNQSITRGLSSSTILSTVRNPNIVLQQSGGNYLYLSKQAAVILNTKGRVITTYPAHMFDENILKILNKIQE